MYIKEIRGHDKEAHEADIVVSDRQYELLCYAHPFTADISDAPTINLLPHTIHPE